MSTEPYVRKFCKFDYNSALPDSDTCRLHSGVSLDYTGTMEPLKTPAQWEAEEGRSIPNRGVYDKVGLETPISYEMWYGITLALTSMWNGNKAPKTISQSQAIEQIETKIEEFKEASYTMPSRQWTDKEWEDHRFAEGHLSGLQQALEILQDL